ncbi:50S ribosomal protein L25/general stress protein Ctc [Metabacillus sp. GX 13764]|uniref:50S ribosomal protein L25/general stress protein Ctc n=1 Tax=Metabacillus kandeliae TaxID=2900151 RepID=UPI001E2E45D5|nr:50S ribosomal protein L25/general stress protein Ctc [Metabacillus kandeliae]MCD7036646.1 50S ribosomal protein L25/general stress protein Ctc [Metabacillus kandeliae]
MSATLQAKERKEFTNSARRKIRLDGGVPAVIYGKSIESQAVALDGLDLLKTLREEGRNAVITIEVNGKKHSVMVNELQTDFMKNEIVHADFITVDMNEEIETAVPVHLTGEAAGVKTGGVLQQPLFELTVTAKPSDIPQSIDVDVSGLEVNDTLTVGDLREGRNYTINHEEDELIASILPPRKEEVIDSGEQQDSEEAETADTSDESEKE